MGSAVPTSKRDFRRLATKRPSISREVLIEVLPSIRATPGFYASRRRTVPFPRGKMKNRANHHRLSLTLSATKTNKPGSLGTVKTISIFAVLQSKRYFPNEDRVGKSIFLISYKKHWCIVSR